MRWLLFIFFGLGIVACQSAEKVESNEAELEERVEVIQKYMTETNEVLKEVKEKVQLWLKDFLFSEK